MAELLLCCEYMAATTILNQTSSRSLSLVSRNLVPQTVVTEGGAVPKTECLEATGEKLKPLSHFDDEDIREINAEKVCINEVYANEWLEEPASRAS